ncbi:putative lipoprotein [Myxococcus hansupus]|uniref:Putative lipoprotein n=1 Tax=Pseudomyxococcus hansupus TaxID=1297742 RepID=A0A0H4XJG7_9BACT|nr:hypothetical protein [Myxococcus hansupus]AKQ68412.1 putative lipoprotein [Myxococcus hansupus]
MKTVSGYLCALAAGVVLSVGCGPSGEAEPATLPEEGGTSQEAPPQDDVEGAAICCNVKCSGTWHGPFPNVSYDICGKFGRYYCGQRNQTYQANAWRKC